MANGRIYGSITGSSSTKYDLWVDWTSVPDGVNMQSTVTVNFYLQRNDGYANSFSDSAANPVSITIDGVTSNTTKAIDTRNGQKALLHTYTRTISHNPNGTKSINISASFSTANNRPTVTSGSVSSTTINLDTITPLMPDISTDKNSYAIGETVTINTNRVQNYTHTVEAKVYLTPSSSVTMPIATGVTNSVVWDTSINANSLYNNFPTKNSIGCIISVSAYNGATLIGTKTKTITLNITNANPIFTDFDVFDTAMTSLTGNSETFIKGYSQGVVNIDPAEPQKGASLAYYEISWGTKTTTVAGDETQGIVAGVDGDTVKVTAVDSRGNKTSVTKTVNFIDYSDPAILTCTVQRTGNIDIETSLNLTGKFTDVDFGAEQNESILEYRYKQTSSDTWGSWTSISHTPSGDDISVGTTLAGDVMGGFDTEKSFDIDVRLRDKISSYTLHFSLPRGIPLVDWEQQGLGIGKVWEHGIMDIVGDIYWNGLKIGDPVQCSFTLGSNTYYAYVAKIGKAVVLLMPEFTGLSGTGTTTLFTLATAYRPSVQRRFDYICFSSAGYGTMASAFLVVETTGEVKIMSNVSGIPSGNVFFAKSFNYFGG